MMDANNATSQHTLLANDNPIWLLLGIGAVVCGLTVLTGLIINIQTG